MPKSGDKPVLVRALGIRLTRAERERVLAYVAKKKPAKRKKR